MYALSYGPFPCESGGRPGWGQNGQAAYGKQILVTVSRELTAESGQAFTLRALYGAIQFCQCFPDREIVSTLSTQLSWSHFSELLPIKDPLAFDFYAESVTRHFYKPQPLRTLDEIRADILAVEQEAGGLLDDLLKGDKR